MVAPLPPCSTSPAVEQLQPQCRGWECGWKGTWLPSTAIDMGNLTLGGSALGLGLPE